MKKILLILMLFCISSFATNRYVSTTGSNTTGDGSINNPWQTITYGVAYVNAGDTLFVRNGTYHEHGIELSNSGTELSPIVIKSYHNEYATINGDTLGMIIKIGETHAVSHCIIDSIGFIYAYPVGIQIGNNYNVSNITIKNCTILETKPIDNTAAIMLYRTWHDIKIHNNVLKNTKWSTDIHTNGIQSFDGYNDSIINNDISGFYNGIYYKFATVWPSRSVVKNNFIHDNYNSGIISQADHMSISNNLIINNSGSGIRLWYTSGAMGGGYSRIEHNTIYNHHSTIVLGAGFGIGTYSGDSAARYDTIINNILCGNNEELSTFALWPYGSATYYVSNPPYDSTNYNLYYNSAGTENFYIGPSDTKYTLLQYKNIYPTYDAMSIEGAPTFTNGSDNLDTITDFELTSSSLGYNAASDAENMGANVGLVGVNIQYQPSAELVVNNGIDTLNFTVSASNATSYQWRVNNSIIEGATGNKLTLKIDSTGYNNNEYDCVVSDGLTTVYSKKYKIFLNNFNRYINKR